MLSLGCVGRVRGSLTHVGRVRGGLTHGWWRRWNVLVVCGALCLPVMLSLMRLEVVLLLLLGLLPVLDLLQGL